MASARKVGRAQRGPPVQGTRWWASLRSTHPTTSMNRILSSPMVQKNHVGTAHCPRRLRHRSAGPHQRTVQSRLEQAFRRTSSEPEAEGGSASFPSSWPTRQTHSSTLRNLSLSITKQLSRSRTVRFPEMRRIQFRLHLRGDL